MGCRLYETTGPGCKLMPFQPSASLDQKISIKMYGKDDCSYCFKAATALKMNNLDYEYIDIEKDPQAKQYVKDEWTAKGKSPTVPLIEINGEHAGGYTELVAFLAETLY